VVSRVRIAAWLLAVPTLVFFLVLVVYPMASLYVVSLFKWEILLPIRRFIGIDNYVALFGDARFLYSLRFTTTLVAVAMLLELLVGLILAQILNSVSFRGKGLVVAAIFLPMTISPTVVGYTWRMIFNPMYGFVNSMLSAFFLYPIDIEWFSDPFWSLLMIVSADFWQWMPFIFIAAYAGLSSLPSEPYEAAVIDGASSLQIFARVQLPQLKGVIIATVLLRAMDAFKVFDYILLTTAGGPGYATESLSYFIYRTVFKITNLGYSSAASVIYLWVATLFIILFYRVMRERMA